MKKNITIALVLLFGSIVFCIASYWLYQQVPDHKAHRDVDSGAYVENASCFSRDGYFSESPRSAPYYTLGYPVFVGLIYKLFGTANYVLVIVQVLLALLSGLFIFRLTQLLFSWQIALLSFFLFSINLGYLVFTQFILSEILLSLFLLIFFERFCAFYKSYSFYALCLSGLSLGFSVTIKPAGLFFVACVALLLFLLKFMINIPFWKSLILFFMSFYLPIIAHMAHNKVMWNDFRLCEMGSVNMNYWFYPNFLATLHGTNSDVEREGLHKIESEAGGAEVSRLLCETLRKHPVVALRVWFINMCKTLFGLFTTNLKVLVDEITGGGCVSFFRTEGSLIKRAVGYIEMGTSLTWVHAVGYVEVIYLVVRYLLSLLACCYLFLRRKCFLLAFIAFYVGYFVGVTGHDGCARFRMMVEFVFIMLTAVGIMFSISLFKRIRVCRN